MKFLRQTGCGRTALSLLTWKLVCSALLGVAASSGPKGSAPESAFIAAEPVSPRDFFNEGTRKFAETNLWRAEYNLERALASQDQRLQPPALYNLGHVRFTQGIEELKKVPSARQTTSQGRTAATMADEAIRAADQALGAAAPGTVPRFGGPTQPAAASEDDVVRALVGSYMRGRGARKELKAATKAVKLAIQAHQNTLSKWLRSSGDFKSALELNQRDADASHNADVVDRSIAKLVDQLRELQQMAMALGQKNLELGEKMKQMRGRIPGDQMPPGAAGDDEEEEQMPFGKEPAKEEGGKKEEQKETGLTAEQAAWLLEGFKLDGDRRLPMTEGKEGKPNDRSKPTW
jgi:hypothetical protein